MQKHSESAAMASTWEQKDLPISPSPLSFVPAHHGDDDDPANVGSARQPPIGLAGK